MSARERAALCEPILLAAAKSARARGLVIVCDAFEVEGGCCVLAAPTTERLPLSSETSTAAPGVTVDHLSEEWDAIECGFDGIPFRVARTQSGMPPPVAFWNLGLRLRRALRPVRAERHQRNIERKEERAVAASRREHIRARTGFTS